MEPLGQKARELHLSSLATLIMLVDIKAALEITTPCYILTYLEDRLQGKEQVSILYEKQPTRLKVWRRKKYA